MRFSALQSLRTGSLAHDICERLRHMGSRAAALRKSREHIHLEEPAPHTVEAFRTFSKWASIVAMVVGYHNLLGWVFDIGILKTPWPTFADTKPSAALCSILAGTALYQIQLRRRVRPRHCPALAQICAALVVFLALVTLLEMALGFNFGLDAWRFPSRDATLVSSAGQMGLTSTLSYLMIGVGIVLLDRPKWQRVSEILALISAAVSLLAIAGYLYQAESFQGEMPLYSAVVIFLISGGVLSARPDRGFMAKVTSNSFGWIMARRLLPATLLIPIVLGWLQHQGQHA